MNKAPGSIPAPQEKKLNEKVTFKIKGDNALSTVGYKSTE
jgi:hypothetical protein